METNKFDKKGIITILTIIAITAVLILAGGWCFRNAGRGSDTMPATITVNGKGELKATPDVSKFTITVEETAKDQSTALAQTSTKINAVIENLKKVGIAEKDIKTEYTSVNPKYENEPVTKMMMQTYPPMPTKQVITGYISSHTLSVKVREIGKVAEVQQIFADLKVQNVSGPDLSIDDIDGLKLDARAKAIDDAKSQAKILSRQLGVRLGRIVSFSESGDGAYPNYMSARADVMMAGKAATPEATIATGEQTVTSNVSITYKIR